MRILVLAGETAGLGPRSTLLGVCRALRSYVPELELATSLRDETDEDPAAPMRGLSETHAVARRSHLVLLTNDAVAAMTLRTAALLQSLDWTRAMTGGVALLEDASRSFKQAAGYDAEALNARPSYYAAAPTRTQEDAR